MFNAGKQCGNGALALAFVRIAVGLFFVMFGAMKLFMMGPDAIVKMMGDFLGLTDTTALAAAWVLMLTEFVGGMIVLAGGLVPRILYHASLLGFAVITIVGYTSKFLPMGMPDAAMQGLWHGMLLLIIFGLFFASPKCPLGITGDKK